MSPPNGENPVSRTYVQTPRLQMSAARVIGFISKISGAGKYEKKILDKAVVPSVIYMIHPKHRYLYAMYYWQVFST